MENTVKVIWELYRSSHDSLEAFTAPSSIEMILREVSIRRNDEVSMIKLVTWVGFLRCFAGFFLSQEELKGDHATYMKSHPELKALLADFLQFLLLRKPEDVVAFAADYFASFSASTKPGSAYATSNEARFVPRAESPFKKNQVHTPTQYASWSASLEMWLSCISFDLQ